MNDGKMTEVEEMNFRIRMTRTIWFLGTVMLGICIPLTNQTILGPFVAFAVLIAVTLTTRTIWGRDGIKNLGSAASAPPVRPAHPAPTAASGRVQELEERLANLEAITNFENKLLNKKFPDAAPVPAAPAYTFEISAREAAPRPAAPSVPVDLGIDEMRRGGARPVAY